jgi:MYXO-CTERM domain-containing protein
VIPVASVLFHPEYGEDHDLGVVEMAEATTVTPIVRNTTPLTAGMAGQDVRVAGFGLSVDNENSNEAGVKLTGLTTLDSLESDYMLVTAKDGQSGCYGDSGGPNFMTLGGVEVLAGITSFGTEDSCLAGYGGNTDVQKYNDWIDDFVTMVEGVAPGPTCGADGAFVEGCPTVDPDCDPGPGPGPGPGDDDAGDDDTGDDDGGGAASSGCSTGGGDHQGVLLIAGIVAVLSRRRRRG